MGIIKDQDLFQKEILPELERQVLTVYDPNQSAWKIWIGHKPEEEKTIQRKKTYEQALGPDVCEFQVKSSTYGDVYVVIKKENFPDLWKKEFALAKTRKQDQAERYKKSVQNCIDNVTRQIKDKLEKSGVVYTNRINIANLDIGSYSDAVLTEALQKLFPSNERFTYETKSESCGMQEWTLKLSLTDIDPAPFLRVLPAPNGEEVQRAINHITEQVREKLKKGSAVSGNCINITGLYLGSFSLPATIKALQTLFPSNGRATCEIKSERDGMQGSSNVLTITHLNPQPFLSKPVLMSPTKEEVMLAFLQKLRKQIINQNAEKIVSVVDRMIQSNHFEKDKQQLLGLREAAVNKEINPNALQNVQSMIDAFEKNKVEEAAKRVNANK